MDFTKEIDIKNRRASFEYSFLEKYIAGIQLKGTEIKSIREGKANLTDSFCTFIQKELWAKGLNISEYTNATHFNHIPKRDRKLLLNKNELNRLQEKMKDKGLAIIPLRLFINEKGFAKLEIALCKGKKTFDKREDIKRRDTEREIARKIK